MEALPAAETLAIRPWPDPVIDTVGHDPRSSYVEQFWLGILGPSTTWLIRRLASGLEANPAGFSLPLSDTARALGLGDKGGRHSPFMRSLGRLCQFDLGQMHDEATLAVRRKVPPLNRRQVTRLPGVLQTEHQLWQEEQLRIPAVEALRRRCRRLALSLVELGEDLEGTERQLFRWKFHPALAHQSAAWAWQRVQEAKRAADVNDTDQADDVVDLDDVGKVASAAS